ncbi:MAG TPA: L-dopachrome tautomerase-related protein [Bacteriovoracaceae bacterium]|nr:L-dopachrome tautomerase-related protein [Bacteriovoracaceae bacterium]
MKRLSALCFCILVLAACSSKVKNGESDTMVDKKTLGYLPTEKQPVLSKVTEFRGVQVTGVTVTESGRLFANFPRWRANVPYSVVEVMPDGSHKLYPDEKWNTWTGKPEKNKFTCVQSVFAHKNSLYVLDPSNPENKGVVGRPMLYEFDLATNKLKRSWSFDEAVAPSQSYLNDIRIDAANSKAYITDSGLGGIVVLNLKNGSSKRVLDKHPSTKSENVILTVEKKKFLLNDGSTPRIHSDGIALSPDGQKLYYHALTGYHLYRVPTDALIRESRNETELVKKVENLGVTPAPDGMIFDQKGNLYMADLERNAVSYRTPSGEMKILIQDERIKWPDTFTIDAENNLIFTDSLLQDATFGKDVSEMSFNIYKVALPR